MARRPIDIYYDVINRVLRDASGNVLRKEKYEGMSYKENILLRLNLVKDASLTAYTEISPSATFEATVDDDFLSSDAPMVGTLNADINLVADWASVNVATGKLCIRLNGFTTPYKTKISSLEELSNTKFEIRVVEGGIYTGKFRFPFRCYGTLADDGTTPPEPAEDFYTKTESDSRYEQIQKGTQFLLANTGSNSYELANKNEIRSVRLVLLVQDATLATLVRYSINVMHDGTSAWGSEETEVFKGSEPAGLVFAYSVSGSSLAITVTNNSGGTLYFTYASCDQVKVYA